MLSLQKYAKNIIFEKTFDGNNNHSYHDVLLTANDSFVVVGQLDSDNIDSMPNKGYNDALIVGYDKDGKLKIGPLWDMDLSAGNPGHLDAYLRRPKEFYVPRSDKNIWFHY